MSTAETVSGGVQRRRAVVASTVGTTIEWYDFFLYNTAASLIFPALFFPEQAAFTGILLSFGTQFVGFAARRASAWAASGAARCCCPWSGARGSGAGSWPAGSSSACRSA